MAAWPDDGIPTVLGEVEPSAKNLVDVPDFERNMLELRSLVLGRQQRNIVMVALFRAPTEETGVGIAVGGQKFKRPR